MRRRLVAIIATLLLLAPGLPATGQSRVPGVGMVVSTPELAIRACPRRNCDIVTSVRLGQTLKITGPAENGFLPVHHYTGEGWAYGLFVAGDQQGVPVLEGGVTGCDRVAIIFNVGIGEPLAWSVLDVLAATDAPATMFVQEWWTDYYPAWVAGMREDGYVVGGHGGKLQRATDPTPLELSTDVADTAAAITAATSAPPDAVFTPYRLDVDPPVYAAIAFAGYLPVQWTLSARDYEADATIDSVTARVLDNAADGAIIEFTLDSANSGTVTAAALAEIIPALRDAGYTLVTVPEIALPCA